MKNFFNTCFLVLLGMYSLQAQNFIRAYSNFPFGGFTPFLVTEDAYQLSDGTYLLSCYNGYLTRVDAHGEPISTFLMQNPSVAGFSRYNLDGFADAGNNEFYLVGRLTADSLFFIKSSLSGDIIWQKSYVTPNNSFRRLTNTPDGGLLVLTAISVNGVLNRVPVLTKLNPDGTLQWQRKYFNVALGSGGLNLYDVSVASNGDYLLTGITNTTGQQRVVVIRLNANGTVLWAKELAATNNGSEAGLLVKEQSNGQIKVVVNNPLSTAKFGTLLLDASGNLLQAKGYSGVDAGISGGVITPGGEVVASVINSGTTLRLAADGSVVFAYNYSLQAGSVAYIYEAFITQDGGILHAGGFTNTLFFDFTPFLIKTSSLGLVPTGFSALVSIIQVGYTPALSAAVITDSSFSALGSLALAIVDTLALYDTLYAVPTALEREHLPLVQPVFYPNPTHSELFVKSDQPLGEIILHNLLGQEVHRFLVTNFSGKTNIGHLPAGMYVASWTMGNRRDHAFVQVHR